MPDHHFECESGDFCSTCRFESILQDVQCDGHVLSGFKIQGGVGKAFCFECQCPTNSYTIVGELAAFVGSSKPIPKPPGHRLPAAIGAPWSSHGTPWWNFHDRECTSNRSPLVNLRCLKKLSAPRVTTTHVDS